MLTTEGEKNIEDIQIGDWVIADDPTTPGDIEPRQVLDTYVRHTNELFDLSIDGEVISTTGEHPFWVPDEGWVKAKDLQIGTTLQTEDGRIIDVDGVSRREGEFTVYNLKVDDFHTYYVSDLEILVHNASYDSQFPTNPGQIQHISRNEPGHLLDTPENRALLKQIADDPTKTLGSDKFGNRWSAETLPDGRQVWVRTRNGLINNGGVNDVPRAFNPDTGLNNPAP